MELELTLEPSLIEVHLPGEGGGGGVENSKSQLQSPEKPDSSKYRSVNTLDVFLLIS